MNTISNLSFIWTEERPIQKNFYRVIIIGSKALYKDDYIEKLINHTYKNKLQNSINNDNPIITNINVLIKKQDGLTECHGFEFVDFEKISLMLSDRKHISAFLIFYSDYLETESVLKIVYERIRLANFYELNATTNKILIIILVNTSNPHDMQEANKLFKQYELDGIYEIELISNNIYSPLKQIIELC